MLMTNQALGSFRTSQFSGQLSNR